MQLTKRMEKQLPKIFDNPKKLRKWIDDVENQLQIEVDKKIHDEIVEYLNAYSITVAFTAHYFLGLGKKRLPEFMAKIWNNLDCFKTGHLSLDDCILELKEYGIEFGDIIMKEKKNANKKE